MEIIAKSLAKRLGRVAALEDVSFEARRGVVALLGTNGSGKTTLLTIIAGLRKPTRGMLLLDGREPYKERGWAARYVKAVFEKPRLPFSTTVGEVVRLVNELRGCEGSVLDLADIADRPLWRLSSGQAQLLGLYAALACHDGVAVLDEPFNHLDKARAAQLARLIEERGGVVFTTHNPVEAALAEYIVVLDKGRVVWSGSRREFYSSNIFKVVGNAKGCKRIGEAGVYKVVECDPARLAQLLAEGSVYAVERHGVY